VKITGLVVCVDYAPQLARSLPIWKSTLDRILVVTAERDMATIDLCCEHGIETFITDAFWRDGAQFNKGAAMAEAFDFLEPDDWHLFFDADVIPPSFWLDRLAGIQPGTLYGAHRILESGVPFREPELAGCFHLAHASDPHMQIKPVVDTQWRHAGNYDSTFQARWPANRRVKLPILLTHIGHPGQNWCGVGNREAMNELKAERRRRRSWRHETVESEG
jgi:hypothetical protein